MQVACCSFAPLLKIGQLRLDPQPLFPLRIAGAADARRTLPQCWPALRCRKFSVASALVLECAREVGDGRRLPQQLRVFGVAICGCRSELRQRVSSHLFPGVCPRRAVFRRRRRSRACRATVEVCLTAIETALHRYFRISMCARTLKLATPRAETPEAWITAGLRWGSR